MSYEKAIQELHKTPLMLIKPISFVGLASFQNLRVLENIHYYFHGNLIQHFSKTQEL